MNLTKQFFKYVSQNIFGLLGTSCYILADTYFISQAAGTDGVTLLNLCLPVYNFIFAVGSMVGLGAATRYAILRAQGDERCQRYFSNAIFCACVLSVPFLLVGIFAPGGLLRLMGGDAGIMAQQPVQCGVRLYFHVSHGSGAGRCGAGHRRVSHHQHFHLQPPLL